MSVHRYDDEHCTGVGLLRGGTTVSSLLAHDLHVRVGSATVRAAGIAAMETAEEYQGRGYARQVIERTAEYLAAERVPLALLYGIEGFYDRFDYAPVVPLYEVRVRVDHPPDAEPRLRVVDCAPGHRKAMAAMYEQNNAQRTGTIVRSRVHPGSAYADRRSWNARTGLDEWYRVRVVVDATGTPVAYVVFLMKDELIVEEIGYTHPGVFRELAACVRDELRAQAASEAVVMAPPDHPFCRYLSRFGCESRVIYQRSREVMGRVTHLPALVESLVGEFARRAKRQGLGDLTTSLRIGTDIGAATVSFAGGMPRIHSAAALFDHELRIPQKLLLQLVTGFRALDDLSIEEDVRLTPGGEPLARALFPPGYPHVWKPDWF